MISFAWEKVPSYIFQVESEHKYYKEALPVWYLPPRGKTRPVKAPGWHCLLYWPAINWLVTLLPITNWAPISRTSFTGKFRTIPPSTNNLPLIFHCSKNGRDGHTRPDSRYQFPAIQHHSLTSRNICCYTFKRDIQ